MVVVTMIMVVTVVSVLLPQAGAMAEVFQHRRSDYTFGAFSLKSGMGDMVPFKKHFLDLPQYITLVFLELGQDVYMG